MTKEDKVPAPKKPQKPATEKKKGDKGGKTDINLKYNKLKKKHRYLRDEYSRVLESWELITK